MYLAVGISFCLSTVSVHTLCSSSYGYAPDSNLATPDEPHHILLYTVLDPVYDIDVVST